MWAKRVGRQEALREVMTAIKGLTDAERAVDRLVKQGHGHVVARR